MILNRHIDFLNQYDMQTIFSRKQFYDLIWSRSIHHLVRYYSISYVDLRTLCFKFNIPIPNPKLCHWQRIFYKSDYQRDPLPAEYFGKDLITLDKREFIDFSDENPRNKDSEFYVPDCLVDPDPLTLQAKKELTDRTYGSYSKMIKTFNSININVSNKNIDRAIILMDTFVKIIKVRGYKIEVTWRTTYLIINDIKLEISLKEREKKVKRSDNSQDLIPTNRLFIRYNDIWIKNEWEDDKLPIEYQLEKIILGLEIIAEKEKEYKAEIEENHRIYKEKERKKQEIKQRKIKELNDFKDLVNQANRWKQAAIMREYISAAILANTQDENWISWASQKADFLDPLKNTVDEYLTDEDSK